MMGLLLLVIVPNFFFTIAFLLDADTLNMANSSFLLSRRNNSIFNGADLFYESSENWELLIIYSFVILYLNRDHYTHIIIQ
jgi:hypothetical protein